MDKQKQSSLDKNATYEEIFKSQHKVIDDRQLIDGVNELQVSSEFVFLPAVEQKYLEQYQLDSTLLSKLTAKVEYLSRKTKEIKQFIKESILHEQREYEPFVIKIQAWYRGCSCRKHLSSMGVKTFNKSRFYPDLPLAIRSAVKIQSVWRGVRTRQQLGDFKIQIVKSLTQTQHKQLKELNSEVFGLKNRIYELGESSQSNTSESEVKHLSSNIENLNEMYKMQQVQIDLLKETVQAQSVQVESMNTVITNQDATINDLNEKLVEKDVELKRFTDASLSQRNDLDMLKAEMLKMSDNYLLLMNQYKSQQASLIKLENDLKKPTKLENDLDIHDTVRLTKSQLQTTCENGDDMTLVQTATGAETVSHIDMIEQ